MDMFLLALQQTNLFGANGVTIFHDAKPKVTTVPFHNQTHHFSVVRIKWHTALVLSSLNPKFLELDEQD
jgi:hypothetical protein